jgi:hypothetical protein
MPRSQLDACTSHLSVHKFPFLEFSPAWTDCQRVGEEIVARRIKGKESVFQDVPVTGVLSKALKEWKTIQEGALSRDQVP